MIDKLGERGRPEKGRPGMHHTLRWESVRSRSLCIRRVAHIVIFVDTRCGYAPLSLDTPTIAKVPYFFSGLGIFLRTKIEGP